MIARATAAVAARELPPLAMRVVLAAVDLLATRSRVEDEVSRSQLAEAAGASERTVTRDLRALSAAGVLGWEPGGFGRPSRLSLRSSSEPTWCPASSEPTWCPATPSETTGSEPSSEPRSEPAWCPASNNAAAAAAAAEKLSPEEKDRLAARLRDLAKRHAEHELRRTPSTKDPARRRRTIREAFLDRHRLEELVPFLEANPSATDLELLYELEPDNGYPAPNPFVEPEEEPTVLVEDESDLRRRAAEEMRTARERLRAAV